MVLYLFHCFQEARDDKLCEILSNSFNKDEIKLCNIRLLPYQISSLGFFLSQSKRNWNLLDLSGCYLDDQGINILYHYLLGCETTIKSLNLVDSSRISSPLLGDILNHLQINELIINCDFINMGDISTALVNSGTVRKLSVNNRYMRFTTKDNIKSAKSFDMIMYLEKLSLTGNILYDTETEMLSEGLAKSKTLKELDLSDNSIGDKGTKAIARSLMSNTSLVVLDLHKNEICDDGIKSLAATLRVNTSLEILNTSYNYIGEDGITELGTALCNISLKELKICTSFLPYTRTELSTALCETSTKNLNCLDFLAARGASAVAASLAHNTSLEVLHMTCDSRAANEIAKALTSNSTLKKLFIYSASSVIFSYFKDFLHEADVIKIIRSLRKNKTLRVLGIPSSYLPIDKEIEYVNNLRSQVKPATNCCQ